MTQEEKDLLLKDLCARLPYKTLISINGERYRMEEIRNALIGIDTYKITVDECAIDSVKPYLFPLSSMTEEQMEELCILCDWHDGKNDAKSIFVLYQEQFVMNADVIDWLYKNHFDYRGLIEQGLAIDATNLNIY